MDVPGQVLELVGSRCKAELEARRTGPGIPFWQHETHYLYVMAEMNDAEGVYLVNTGMRGADLTATQQAYAFAGVGTPIVREGVAPMVTPESFELGATRLTGLESAFGFFEQTTTADGFRLDGMIGLGVVGRLRWTLDFATRRIYFAEGTPTARPKKPAKAADTKKPAADTKKPADTKATTPSDAPKKPAKATATPKQPAKAKDTEATKPGS
jgi:hypothetical protein